MSNDITLTTAVRSNLLQLQRTSSLVNRTQDRLASGLEVGSPIDGASAFFTAGALNNRADDFQALRDDVDLGISAVAAAIDGLDAITELVEQAKGLANNAKATGDTSEQSTLAVQFNDILSQIDDLANDSSFNGTNLVQASPDNLTIDFNEDASSTLTISGLDSTTASTGLNIANATNNFADSTAIDTAITAVNSAITELRSNASTLGSSASVLQTRLDFGDNLIGTLQDGAA